MKKQLKTNNLQLKKFLSASVPKCLSAFTLAETLIVIGIIGVVAALTLPNLNHATGDKEKVTKVKKIYSALTDAVDRAQVIYGDIDTWFKDCHMGPECNERFAKRVTEFMKISKDCGFDEGCFSSAPLLRPNGEIYEDDYLASLQGSAYMATTSDGMSLCFRNTGAGRIRVDIDGPNKGKNQMGNDLFDFTIGLYYSDTINTKYLQLIPDFLGVYSEVYDYPSFNGYSTAWVIENGNMDYLKCPDELNWETKTSCE